MYYQHRVDLIASLLYLHCSADEQSTFHLFSCTSVPTPLVVSSYWSAPCKVAIFFLFIVPSTILLLCPGLCRSHHLPRRLQLGANTRTRAYKQHHSKDIYQKFTTYVQSDRYILNLFYHNVFALHATIRFKININVLVCNLMGTDLSQ